MIDAVDDEHIDGGFRRFDFDAQLFAHGGEQVGRVGIDGRRIDAGRQRSWWRYLGGECEFEFPVAGQAGAVDGGAPETVRDPAREERQWISAESNASRALLNAADGK